MEQALYHAVHGFYSSGAGSPGRRGDFLTAVEVGPLFGAVMARYLDHCWERLGQPDPFCVVEAGAGAGTWARSIRAARPRCGSALALTLVERSEPARAHHPEWVTASLATMPHPGGPHPGPTNPGAVAVGRAHVVLANELLDNLAFRLFEWQQGKWWEVWVDHDGLHRRVPLDLPSGRDLPAARLDSLVPAHLRMDGLRLPLAGQAATWVADTVNGLLPGGRLVTFDYGADTAELATRPDNGWLRTYRAHQPGRAPWVDPGTQDITAEVPFDQLPSPDLRCRQAQWLQRWGLAELVAEGRQQWQARAGIGDLAALIGRSRVREAEALTQPGGLGDFVVCEWHRPAVPIAPVPSAPPAAPPPP